MLCIGTFVVMFLMMTVCAEKKYHVLSSKNSECKWVVVLVIFAFGVAFYDCIFGGWKIAFSNFMYAVPPFNSLSISIKGPSLSDIIDAQLPGLYNSIVQRHFFDFWNESNAFGVEDLTWEWLDIKKLVFLFGLEFGETVLYVVKYMLAGLGMYLFMRKIGIPILGSFLGGVIFAFSSVMVVWHGWPHTDVTAYAPLLYYYVECIFEKYIEEKRYYINGFLCFCLILFLMLITGMPTYVPFFLYVGIVYTIFRVCCLCKPGKDGRFILALFGGLGIASALAIMMSFVYTGGLLNSLSDYAESRSSLAFTTLDFEYLRTMILPYLRDGLTLHINESTLFTGFLFLFIIPVYALTKKTVKREYIRQIWFWGILLIGVLLCIFDNNTGLFYQAIPVLNTSGKIRIIVLFNFIAAILSSLCFALIYNSESDISIIKSSVIYLVPAVVAFELNEYLGSTQMIVAMVILIAIAMCVQVILLKGYKWVSVLLCFIVTLHMGTFAREYIPCIEKDAQGIPEATSSIQYLQNNTHNGERFAAVGIWTLFPNLNLFYNINDIRYHGFSNTYRDISAYMKGIDSDVFPSATRTEISKIDHENLLKYASVFYIASVEGQQYQLKTLAGMIEDAETTREPYAYYGEDVIQQSFTSKEAFDSISLLLSTYSRTLSDKDFMTVAIADTDGNKLAEKNICLMEIEDNKFYTVDFERTIPQGRYELLLSGNEMRYEFPVALWLTGNRIYDGGLSIGEAEQSGSVSFLIDSQAIRFDDGMSIRIIPDSSPRAFLADTIYVKESEDEILAAMEAEYFANTAFITTQYQDRIPVQSDYPTSEILEYVDEGEKVTISLDGAKGEVLVLTDYFTDSWDVYVDGEKAECLKVNYLFRGVALQEDGQHTVTFVHNRNRIIRLGCISLTGMLLLLAIIIERKRLQRAIEIRFI